VVLSGSYISSMMSGALGFIGEVSGHREHTHVFYICVLAFFIHMYDVHPLGPCKLGDLSDALIGDA